MEAHEVADGEIIVKLTNSFIWKGLAKTWSNLEDMESWEVGDGLAISLWNDIWVDSSTRLHNIVVHTPDKMFNWKVSDFVDLDGNWKMNEDVGTLPEVSIRKPISFLAPREGDGSDRRIWSGNKNGDFSIASAYSEIHNISLMLNNPMWK